LEVREACRHETSVVGKVTRNGYLTYSSPTGRNGRMGDDQDKAKLVDVSAGGARLVHGRHLEVGSVHEFTFDLLGETIRVQARVRHCLPEEHGQGYQVGVQFLNVEPASAQRLREYAGRRRGRA
jgi:c-di-GMP-binding flagellar brake protein YcgR